MTLLQPAYSDGLATCYQGDALAVLRELPAASVDCVVTSPAYWGLRDYGTGAWEGGDPGCEHRGTAGRGGGLDDQQQAGALGHVPGAPNRGGDPGRCRCGAVRVDLQLGLEPTPELYVEHMVAVFREVRRVMRPWATLWLNMGDCYAGYHGNARVSDAEAPSNKPGYTENMRGSTVGLGQLKSKDLVGMPWRLAFALQADGWYLRSDIVWSKPNPMPESVTDRPTKSHEYLFLLSRSSRYYYDAEAILEPSVGQELGDVDGGAQRNLDGSPVNAGRNYRHPNGPQRSPYGQGFTRRSAGGRQAALARGDDRYRDADFPKDLDGRTARMSGAEADPFTRNKRSVWEIPTQPSSKASRTSRSGRAVKART